MTSSTIVRFIISVLTFVIAGSYVAIWSKYINSL